MVAIPEDVLNDIFSRFIIPEAKSNANDPIRLCFAIEMGHWFYLDYIRPSDSTLPDCAVEAFAKKCFKHMPSLLRHQQEANLVLKQWRDFKRRVPVYGAMLITPDTKHVLLVEGNSTRGCWTFPRGKIEEDEDPFDCAIREVWEETSFDISSLADRNYFIEKICSDRRVRLYIVHNVPKSTLFYPKVRGEIANHRWFPIDDLPGATGYKKKKESFFMVNQFIREYFKGYRTGKKRNNASECDRSRNRGSSFNDGDAGLQYSGRRDSYHDNREERRSRDARPRDRYNDQGYLSEPPNWEHEHHRGMYPQDPYRGQHFDDFSRAQYPHLRHHPHDPHRGQHTQDPYKGQDPHRSQYPQDPHRGQDPKRGQTFQEAGRSPQHQRRVDRPRLRGGRTRRGQNTRFPAPPETRLADFSLDLDALIDMLPDIRDIPKFTPVRS